MNAPAPEAENEYSNSSGTPGRRSAGRLRWSDGGSWPITAVGLIGAALLIAAEFRPLYIVHVTTYGAGTTSVSTGSHDSFALVPIALLAAGLALIGARQRTLAADAALAGLGVLVLLITLIGDLPDTHARGIATGPAFASTTAGAGLYLETLGAVLLLGAGGAGVLTAVWARRPPRRRRGRRRPGSAAGQPDARMRQHPSGESAS
jgi:hypothetical protein